jgi:hypothetical protein
MAGLVYKRAFNQLGTTIHAPSPPGARAIIFVTPSEGCTVSQANVYIYQPPTDTTSITIAIRAVDGDNLPILPNLASDTIAVADGIMEGGNVEYPVHRNEASLSCILSGSTNYALLIIPLDGTKCVPWSNFRLSGWDEQYDKDEGTLGYIDVKHSPDGGATWGDGFAPSNFEVHGVLLLPPAPTVTTSPASSVGQTTATLNGILVDDGGEACACGFEWGGTEEYGTTTPTESKNTSETFEQVISGLTPGKHYHFRALATNSAGTSYGSDRGFFAKGGIRGNPNIDQLIYQHVERMD